MKKHFKVFMPMPSDNNGSLSGRDEKGKYLPGNPGKQRGSTRNRLREEIKSFLNERWQDFPTWFDKLKEKEKIQTMLDLMPYALSRLQSVSMTDADGNDVTPRASYDYTKLSPAALREVLSLTTINENGNE